MVVWSNEAKFAAIARRTAMPRALLTLLRQKVHARREFARPGSWNSTSRWPRTTTQVDGRRGS